MRVIRFKMDRRSQNASRLCRTEGLLMIRGAVPPSVRGLASHHPFGGWPQDVRIPIKPPPIPHSNRPPEMLSNRPDLALSNPPSGNTFVSVRFWSDAETTGRHRPILLKNSLFARRPLGRWRDRQSIGEENGRVNAPWSLCGEAFRLFLHGWHQPLGHSPQILRYGCHQKLIVCTLQTSQAQSVEPQDAFEVSKQHLDLLAFAA